MDRMFTATMNGLNSMQLRLVNRRKLQICADTNLCDEDRSLYNRVTSGNGVVCVLSMCFFVLCFEYYFGWPLNSIVCL